ncbi:MAG: PfkB family carbohydrate kinase [Candidatus Omnitrophica bacterium]|nr:PfkB family carbohydrate kinase [Candidatus Omnitrophota bacterium]
MIRNDKILIIGSVAVDCIETPFGKRAAVLGGSATFSSVSASFFNRNTGIVAVIGDDFPAAYRAVFKKRGIDIRGLRVIPGGKTFRWSGNYTGDMNSPVTLYTHLNVFKDFKPSIPEGERDAAFVFLANIDPDLQGMVLRQIKNPSLVVCDTMNYWIANKPRALKKLLKRIDIFLLNEGEARQLSGEHNLLKAARAILAYGTSSVVIKKGEYGVLFFSKRLMFQSPAYLLEDILDPTGAGDTFAGGMLGYLSGAGRINDASIRTSLIYGTIMASFAVQDFSVDALLRLRQADIRRRFDEFVRMTKFC